MNTVNARRIFRRETDPNKLEIALSLPSSSNPIVPLTGWTPQTGDVKLLLPTASGWVDVSAANVLPKSNDVFSVQLATTQVLTAGTGYVYASVAGAQPFTDSFDIIDPGTWAIDPNQGELAFDLPDATNPLTPYDSAAHVFTLGQVLLRLPGASSSWLSAPPGQIVTKGYGIYAVQLTAAQKVSPGIAYLFANVPGSQNFYGEYEILSLDNFTARPAWPALTYTTTVEAIRDRMIAVIAALTPKYLSDDRFIPYRNEGGADFNGWCEGSPAGARRRFQVRDTGDFDPVFNHATSNSDQDLEAVTFRILIAYPQTQRDGADAALDRDDAMRADQRQIERAVGMWGRSNFSSPYPEACWQTGSARRIVGQGVDFLEITQTMLYVEAPPG